MKISTKILIIAGSLILVGCIAFVCVMSALKWDFTKLSTAEYETNTTEITENFSNITISTETANIVFASSENEKCKVECYEDVKAKHSVTVENDALVIKIDNQKSWYDYIGFNFGVQKITVYLPKTQYNALSVKGVTGNVKIAKEYSFNAAEISLTTGIIDFSASVLEDLKIKTTTGNVTVADNAVGSIDVSVTTGTVRLSKLTCKNDITVGVTTGRTYLTDITCENLSSSGTTGNIDLTNVIAKENLSVKRSTGNVKLDGIDAAEITLKTSTGNVTGSILTNKKFVTDTSTGKVDVPTGADGGVCNITTSTGNIKITIKLA